MTDIVANPGLKGVDLSKENLANLFEDLQTPPSPLPRGWKQNRGYGLERILHEALRTVKMNPLASFKPTGEQIDGAFELDSRYFLYEAKWHDGLVSGPEVGGFQSKVTSKLSGTLGIFFSVTGFVDDIADYVTRGTPLTVLLADGDDIAYGLRHGMDKMLREKVRAAAYAGLIYYQRDKMHALLEPVTPTSSLKNKTRERSVWIITEGPWDGKVIELVSDLVKTTFDVHFMLRTIPAYGVAQAFTVADAAARLISSDEDQVIVVVDGDGRGHAELQAQYAAGLDPKISLVVADPNLEAWFGIDVRRREARGGYVRMLEVLHDLDIQKLRAERSDADQLISLLVGDTATRDSDESTKWDAEDVDWATHN